MNELDLDKIAQTLEELTGKVEKLAKSINIEKGHEIEEENKLIEKLSAGIKDLTKYLDGAKGRVVELKGQCEDKVSENPIAYIVGAFVGGLILGNLTGRKNS